MRLNSSVSGCEISPLPISAVLMAFVLQQHDPCGDAHEHRRPERNQHEDHHEVGPPLRQRRDPVRERIAEQQREQRDGDADHERCGRRSRDRSTGRGRPARCGRSRPACGRARRAGRTANTRCRSSRSPASRRHRPSANRNSTSLSRVCAGVSAASLSPLQRHRARRLRDERAIARNLGVQPPRSPHRLAVGHLRHVGRECDIRGVGRRRLAVPARQRPDRVRQRCGDLGVLHRAREQRADRHDENQQQENRERRDQQQCHRALAGLGGLQLALERGVRRRGRRDRHRIQRFSPAGHDPAEGRATRSTRRAAGCIRMPERRLLRRPRGETLLGSSLWSVQKPMSSSTAFLPLAGEFGRFASVFASSDLIAAMFVGPYAMCCA